MTKQEKIEKLRALRTKAEEIFVMSYDDPRIESWKRDVTVALKKIFDEDHAREFNDVFYCIYAESGSGDYIRRKHKQIQSSIETINSMIREIEEWPDNYGLESADTTNPSWAASQIKLIFDRFDLVARQLRQRYDNRQTLDLENEYDVQDLFHALLKLYFDDIRDEEWTPSYAGSSSRMDFLLNVFGIVIEIKMTRKGLGNKEVSDQLAIDKDHYRSHPKANHLICFIYDPDGRIRNPRGFENDLRQEAPLKTDIYIRP